MKFPILAKILFTSLLLGAPMAAALVEGGTGVEHNGPEGYENGCVHYCNARHPTDPNVQGGGAHNYGAWSDCMALSRKEGYCGSARQETPAERVARTEDPPMPATRPPDLGCDQFRSQYQSIKSQCQAQGSPTSRACDSANMPKIAGLDSQSNQGSVQNSCQSSSNLMSGAIDGMKNFSAGCQEAIRTCRSTCDQMIKFLDSHSSCFQVNEEKQGANFIIQGVCDKHTSAVNTADQAIASYEANKAQSDNCSESTDGGATPEEQQAAKGEEGGEGEGGGGGSMGDLASMLGGMGGGAQDQNAPPVTFCQQNPTAPGCSNSAQVNCLDPAQATTNKVCVCANNPFNPMCGGNDKTAQSQMGMGGDSIDSSSRMPTASDDGANYDAGGIPSMAQGPRDSSGGGGSAVDGQQGSSNPVGQSSVGGGGKGFRAAQVQNPDAPAGTSGGGGGFGGGGRFGAGAGGGGGGGSAGAPPRGYGLRPGEDSSASTTPDLRKFLPGGSFDPKNRGMAGSSGPDGITGPHSNIWQKIQNRYHVISPSLMP